MRDSCLAPQIFFEAKDSNLDVAALAATLCFATLSKLSLFETLLRVRVAKMLDAVTYACAPNRPALDGGDFPSNSMHEGTDLLNFDTIIHLRGLLNKLTKNIPGLRLLL